MFMCLRLYPQQASPITYRSPSLMFTIFRKRSRSTVKVHSCQLFPPEIVGRIVDELSLCDERTTLLACTLVSPGFRYFSQKRLFEQITLSTQHEDETIALYRLLYQNPDLSCHIRNLSLSYITETDGSYDEDLGNLAGSLLPDVMMKLRSLVSLHLIGFSHNTDSWVYLTPDAQKALIHLGRSTQITTIQFDEIRRWPIAFLYHFPHLRCIKINSSWDPFVDDITLDEPPETDHTEWAFPELEELQMKCSYSPTLISCIRPSYPCLRVLTAYSDNISHTSTIEELVRSSATSLEKLKVYHDQYEGTGASLSKGTLGNLTSLRRMSVKGYGIDACGSLIALLKNTAGICPINEVSIELNGIDRSSLDSGIVWEELNRCFIQHLEFSHLQTVRIFVEIRVPWGERVEYEGTELLERFFDTLPCIQENLHIFQLDGNHPKFFEHAEEEPTGWYRSLRQILLG